MQGVSAFIVFSDSHLRAIASHKPTTVDALAEIRGIGPRRLANYGPTVIELVLSNGK